MKAAALAHLLIERGRDDHETDVEEVYSEHASLARATCSCGWQSQVMDDGDARDAAWTHREHDPHPAHGVARCEGCGHPWSDGTWEGDGRLQPTPHALRLGVAPTNGVHWSPCDTGCQHSGSVRMHNPDQTDAAPYWSDPLKFETSVAYNAEAGLEVEASWRGVDVRTLGWPHDLRPQMLALLCLRCLAAR